MRADEPSLTEYFMTSHFTHYWQRRRQKLLKPLVPAWNRLKIACRWHFRRAAPLHGRDRQLIVSLTSHAKRFPTLPLTLKCLLTQSVRPDQLVLWLAEVDRAALPESVASLQQEGLAIRYCEDLRSYKKIIPSLASSPEADIVTADDDVYYWSDWLKELVLAAERFPQDVVAHRMHRMLGTDQAIRPYREWPKKITDQTRDRCNFATGIGGVFYPAGCFHPDVLKRNEFMRLCPDADDVWLYWMVRLNGRYERHSGTRKEPVNWPGSQAAGLWKRNKTGNDVQIRAMIERYGLPVERDPAR